MLCGIMRVQMLHFEVGAGAVADGDGAEVRLGRRINDGSVLLGLTSGLIWTRLTVSILEQVLNMQVFFC
jgi:hypothetical protein